MAYKNCGPKETIEYALYKGEELLVMGTASEIAEHQGISVGTVRFLASNVYKKRVEARERSKNPKIAVRIGEIEEDAE